MTEWEDAASPMVAVVTDALDSLDEREDGGERTVEPDSIRARETAFDGDWANEDRPDPVTTAYCDGEMYANAARDHLRGAANVVLTSTAAIYSSFVLARSSIEAAAYGAWLLEPGIGVKSRLERGFIDRCWQLSESVKMLQAGVEVDSAREAEKQHTRLNKVFRWGYDRRLTTKTKAKTTAGQRPSNVDRISDHLAVDDAMVPGRGGWYYRYLCGSTHSNPMILRQFGAGNPFENLADGTRVRRMSITVGDALFPVVVALRSLQTVERHYAAVRGWESPDDIIGPALAELLRHY